MFKFYSSTCLICQAFQRPNSEFNLGIPSLPGPPRISGTKTPRPPRLGDYGTLHSPLYCVDDRGRMHCTLVDVEIKFHMSFQMCKHKEYYFNYFQDPLILKVSLGMNHDSFARSPKSRW